MFRELDFPKLHYKPQKLFTDKRQAVFQTTKSCYTVMTLPIWLFIGITTFFASATLRLVGFGAGMIGMSMLVPLLGTLTAAPLLSLLGVVNLSIAVTQFRRSLTLGDVWRIVAAMLISIPIGVLSISYLPETFLRGTIGVACIAFALYRAVRLPLPEVENRNWGFLVGMLGGFMGGSVNIPGVPVILYAETQDWEINRYRTNLFTVFLCSSSIALISRAFAGQYTSQIFVYWLQAIPFLLIGQVVGYSLTFYVNRELFRKLVLLVIFAMGVRILM